MPYKLPFTSQPKSPELVSVGDESIGTLEIPKLYDLTPNERIFIRQELKDSPDLRLEGVRMAKAIAAKSGQKIMDTYNAITSGDLEYLGDYLEEFVEFQDTMTEIGQKRQAVTVTAVLKFRVCPEWTIDDSGDAEQMSPKLLSAVYEFTQKEEAGWVEVKADEPMTDETLGKSLSEATETTPTGEASTGLASDIVEVTDVSVPSDLEVSPVG